MDYAHWVVQSLTSIIDLTDVVDKVHDVLDEIWYVVQITILIDAFHLCKAQATIRLATIPRRSYESIDYSHHITVHRTSHGRIWILQRHDRTILEGKILIFYIATLGTETTTDQRPAPRSRTGIRAMGRHPHNFDRALMAPLRLSHLDRPEMRTGWHEGITCSLETGEKPNVSSLPDEQTLTRRATDIANPRNIRPANASNFLRGAARTSD